VETTRSWGRFHLLSLRGAARLVEGLNSKLKLTLRKSQGSRTFPAAETARYHALGDLLDHRLCSGGEKVMGNQYQGKSPR
jgi:hypothetical protein